MFSRLLIAAGLAVSVSACAYVDRGPSPTPASTATVVTPAQPMAGTTVVTPAPVAGTAVMVR